MAFVFTDENAKAKIAAGGPVVIDFWATWCGPCMRMAPIVDELAEQYDGQVLIGKYNVEDGDELAVEFGIRNIPTLLFFKDGELKERSVGSMPKNELEAKIKSLL